MSFHADYFTRSKLEPRGIHFRGELPEEALESITPIRLAYVLGSHYQSVVPAERTAQSEGDAAHPPLGSRRTSVLRYVASTMS
jgi:hypothetical protein